MLLWKATLVLAKVPPTPKTSWDLVKTHSCPRCPGWPAGGLKCGFFPHFGTRGYTTLEGGGPLAMWGHWVGPNGVWQTIPLGFW